MKTLYFDCFSGISGDMVIGALIDAGADPNHLVEELIKLPIQDEYELTWKKVVRNGITSTKFDVLLKNENTLAHLHAHDNKHEESHELAHGHDHHHHHHENHDHEHHQHHEGGDHDHDHHHEHAHSHHHHHHRSYKDIVNIIESAGFSERVKETASRIFRKIGEAEGRIHGIPLENVHFHEVGAVDSIIDIVGAAILIHQLDISSVKSSPIPVGNGKIRIDHGIYPVPAPATLDILKGVPIEKSDIRGELTTPTGAAIVAALSEAFGPLPSMTVQSVGYGAGTKTFAQQPNVLRAIIGKE